MLLQSGVKKINHVPIEIILFTSRFFCRLFLHISLSGAGCRENDIFGELLHLL